MPGKGLAGQRCLGTTSVLGRRSAAVLDRTCNVLEVGIKSRRADGFHQLDGPVLGHCLELAVEERFAA